MVTRDIKEIKVIGRRWFQSTYGNTYHSVEIYINGNFVYKVPFNYGYDSQFQSTALNYLIKEVFSKQLNTKIKSNKYACLYTVCEDIIKCKFDSIVYDVNRKKDL